jgi:protein SCO1
MRQTDRFSRRSFLQAALAATPVLQGHGRIKPPLTLPDIGLVRNDGASTRLRTLTERHVTAVQLVFTRCTTTCPIQASIFCRVQSMIPGMAARGIQLLSLSIDPDHDSPKVLSGWLRRFHAGPGWIAASPLGADRVRLSEISGAGNDSYDHSTQVQIVDRNGLLVWRTSDLPAAEEIAFILQRV